MDMKVGNEGETYEGVCVCIGGVGAGRSVTSRTSSVRH